MSESKAIVTLEQQLAKLDEIASQSNVLALTENAGQFSAALDLADKMNALRDALTPQIMERFMKLQGNSLGFRTDRDNNEGDAKGYSVDVVRDVMIEATFKGFRLIGNETNIIGGRFYGTREGFQARMRELAKKGMLTDLRITPGVPKTVADGAIVTMSASWKWKNVADSISVEVPIRVNKGQGADAILGKAERKLLAKIYSRVTNTEITDGEVGDMETMKRAEPAAGATTPPPAREFCDEATVELLKKHFADHAEYLNPYLLEQKLIEKGEDYTKVPPKIAKRMLDCKKALLEQCGAVVAKK